MTYIESLENLLEVAKRNAYDWPWLDHQYTELREAIELVENCDV